MTAGKFLGWLYDHGADPDLQEWARGKTLERAWAMCEYGGRLLWILRAAGVDCSRAGYWCAYRALEMGRPIPPELDVSPDLAAAYAVQAAVDSAPRPLGQCFLRYNEAAGWRALAENRAIADYVRANYACPELH